MNSNPSPAASRSSPAPRAASAHATALALAKAGAHVVAVARTVGGLEELDDAIKAAGGSATLVPLDLKDYDGIERLALRSTSATASSTCWSAMPASSGRSRRSSHVEPKAWDDVIAVNVTANWHLIRSHRSAAAEIRCRARGVRDLRRRAGPGLLGALLGLQGGARTDGAHLCGRDARRHVRVNMFNPGPMRTRMRASAMPGDDPMTLRRRKTSRRKSSPCACRTAAETGTLYSFREKKFIDFHAPA